jgi:argininosuccinate lyase
MQTLCELSDFVLTGVGALSGHPFGIDRKALAADLGFDGVIPNSLDAVKFISALFFS